jgi:hypothetical protein
MNHSEMQNYEYTNEIIIGKKLIYKDGEREEELKKINYHLTIMAFLKNRENTINHKLPKSSTENSSSPM